MPFLLAGGRHCGGRVGGTVCVIEVDRELSREAAAHFVNRWRWVLPGTRRLCSEYFVRFVAGQGLTERDLVTLFGDAGLSSVNVQRVPDQPFVVGIGNRRSLPRSIPFFGSRTRTSEEQLTEAKSGSAFTFRRR